MLSTLAMMTVVLLKSDTVLHAHKGKCPHRISIDNDD